MSKYTDRPPCASQGLKLAAAHGLKPANAVSAFRGAFATVTAVAALLALPRPGLAAPTGGSVVAGSATISTSGTTTNINQSTNQAIINWMRFSIAPNETVKSESSVVKV
jgi:hypothetical protein